MNTVPFFPLRAGGKRLFALLVLFCASFAVAACMPQSQSSGSSVPGATTHKLPYGITIDIPEGWTVSTSVAPEAADKASIDSRVRGGERIMVIDFKRPANTPQGMDARVGIFILDSTKNFLPRDVAAKLTDEDFTRMAQSILQREQELAAKNKAPSNTLDWKVSREAIDGRMVILQRGLGQGPEGQVRVLNWDIYLEGDSGVAVKMLGAPQVPGTETLLESIARSVRIAK